MMGDYWAQPEGQRLTFHHRTTEVEGERGFRKRNAINGVVCRKDTDTEVVETVRDYLRSGVKTRAQIKKHLNIKTNSDMKTVITTLTAFAPDVYEDELPGNGRNKQIIFGLVDRYDEDEYLLSSKN